MAADDLTRIQVKPRSHLALRSQQNGELIELQGEMIIGREIDCDVQLGFLQVSRYHAKIYVASNGLFIEDLNSSNGTYVNGKAIKQRTQLKLGDQLSFDNLHFRVTTARASEADQTQLSSSQANPQKHAAFSVNEINRLAGDQLKPAASTASEKAREFPIYQTPDRALATSEPAIKTLPPKDADAPQITDLEAFLKFAGSGLHPQALEKPVSDAPYRGILNKKTRDPEAPARFTPAASLPLEDPSERVLSKELKLEPEAAPRAAAEEKTPPPAPDHQGDITRYFKPAKTASEPSRNANKANKIDRASDDSTLHIGLRDLDRFVLANQYHHQELSVGSGPRFIAMTAPIRGKVFELKSQEEVQCWSIGRDDSADICLRDKAVSREHAWITKYEALYQLRVNENACDVLINGAACSEAELQPGDRIQVGAMELLFRTDYPTVESAAAGDTNTNAPLWSRIGSAIKKFCGLD